MNGIKTDGKHVGKQLATDRTCFYSRQLFNQLFRVGTIGKYVSVPVNQTKHALYSRDLWRTQVNTFKFVEEVYNCPAVWEVSSISHHDTKNKQEKMEELENKLGFV